jgi:arylsulfatase A-like enzyme
LFIITDQQRYDALAYAGNSVIQTPNLDRLAQQGAFFRNAYTPCAVCGPARSSILTGFAVENTGVYSNDQTYFYSDTEVMSMPTFDEILAEKGYRCEYYGKWHALSSHAEIYENPVQITTSGHSIFGSGGQSRVYRDYLATLGSTPNPGEGEFVDGISKYPYLANPLDRYYGMSFEELQSSGLIHSQPDQHGELRIDKEHTMTAFQARQALEAIERLKDTTFSITCSFHFPHSPMLAPVPYYGMYPVEDMIPPSSINDEMQNSPYVGSNQRKKRTEYADPEKIKYMISEYYGLISEIDEWVGKILDKLDELGIADNTMIIFTSDHGEMLGAHGMREKNVFFEESAHIPLLISSIGDVPAETIVEGYVSLIDLFPTILDYLDVPEQVSEGKSLRGLIEGTDTVHGRYVVTEWDRDNISNYMVIKDGWKLIIPYTIKSTVINAMYDLNSDPYEINNLLGSNPDRALYQEEAEELRACLLEWLAARNSIHYYSVSQRDLLNGGKPTGNDAEFVSQDVHNLRAGDTVTVSITMKNTGITPWTQSGQFKLGSQGPADNKNWGTERVLLHVGDSIVPGAEKTFTFEVIVPDVDGIFNFQWQMVQDGEEWFGAKSELKQVVSGNPGSYLDDCDEIAGWKSSSGLTLNVSDYKQGNACIEFTGGSTDEFKKVFG